MRCCIRSAFRSIVSSIVRRCSAVGSEAGSSSRPVSVRITVIGVRSSWAMIDRKSVRIRSRSFMGTAASVQAPCSTRRRPRLERTYSAVVAPASDANQTERLELARAAPRRRRAAGRRHPRRTALEIGGRRPALDELRAPHGAAVSSRPGDAMVGAYACTTVRRAPRRGPPHRPGHGSVGRGGEAGPHRTSRCTVLRRRSQSSRTEGRHGSRRFRRSDFAGDAGEGAVGARMHDGPRVRRAARSRSRESPRHCHDPTTAT